MISRVPPAGAGCYFLVGDISETRFPSGPSRSFRPMETGSVLDSRPVSGHVFRMQRKRGPQWYVKFRGADGRQVQRRLGPAWTGRGRPPVGYFTKRTAEGALDEILADARRGLLAGQVRTGVTF